VALGQAFTPRTCVVHDGDQPVTSSSDVEDDISIDRIRIRNSGAKFHEALPPTLFDDVL